MIKHNDFALSLFCMFNPRNPSQLYFRAGRRIGTNIPLDRLTHENPISSAVGEKIIPPLPTEAETDRQTDRQTDRHCFVICYNVL